VLGFLGPNGAGKTTTIRILTTILTPSSGDFSVDGISSKYPDEIRRTIGVLPEGLGFPKGVTAIEYLTYFGQLFGRSAAEARRVGLVHLKDMGLQHRADTAIGTFSRGMRQRLGIARALVEADPVLERHPGFPAGANVGFARADGDEVTFVRPTHQELAARVGSSREVVTRVLKQLLEEEEALSAQGRVMRVVLHSVVLPESELGG
jgi:predicted ABC-type transport system involved in lysophospholipase L1 biosynthesis ATPase subunit